MDHIKTHMLFEKPFKLSDPHSREGIVVDFKKVPIALVRTKQLVDTRLLIVCQVFSVKIRFEFFLLATAKHTHFSYFAIKYFFNSLTLSWNSPMGF